jgi:hypothetical protein
MMQASFVVHIQYEGFFCCVRKVETEDVFGCSNNLKHPLGGPSNRFVMVVTGNICNAAYSHV